ncbi:MAG: ATP synthase F1 subunit gamma [Clostridiales bacterium]|nr:ATP synthase F1 subunit gamma [Clostridiales bacterium]
MAGASMKDIKLRIKSVESTMQITKAMQLVATSKLRRAKERMETSKPYAAIAGAAIRAAAHSCPEKNIPFLAGRPLKKRCYVVIAGDRGLAGGYNANVFKAVLSHCQDVPYCVMPLGKKSIEKFHRGHADVLSDAYGKVEGMTVGQCAQLARQLIAGYLAEQYDELWLVYTSFQSMITQNVEMEMLLPIPMPEEGAPPASTIYELKPEETLEMVMPDFLAGRLYSAICDSFASEVASRRSAMDSATKNAGEMINDLRLKYNRARQGAITQEITEIVAGAEH